MLQMTKTFRGTAQRALIAYAVLGVLSGTPSMATAQTADTLSFGEAIHQAIEHSPSMAAGMAAVEAARARYATTESYTLPQISGDATYTRLDPVVTLTIPGPGGVMQSFSTMPHDMYNVGISISEPVLAFGRFSAGIKLAESGIHAAQDGLDQVRAQAAYQTARLYYALLTTDESLRVEQDQLHVLETSLAVTEAREKQGAATKLDPLTVQVRISAIRSQISDLTAARTKQESMLRRLIGRTTIGHIAVRRPAQGPALPTELDALMELAMKGRPEITLARDAEQSVALQIDVIKASDDPLVSANVAGGVKDGYLPNLTQGKLNWAGTVNLHVPIIDGGRTRSQVDEAEANLRAAKARTEDVILSVRSDVEQARAEWQASRDRVELVRTQIEQAKEAYDIAKVRYQNGASTNLDLMNAEQALEQAKLQYAQVSYSYELSQYELCRAVGTPLW